MSTTRTGIFTGTKVRDICGTCQFWHAETRIIGYNGKRQQDITVDVQDNNQKAFCELTASSVHKNMSAYCSKWKQWVNIN